MIDIITRGEVLTHPRQFPQTIKTKTMTTTTKGDKMILKNGKEVIFSHWEKKHGNGSYFFDINNKKYHIKELA